MVWAIEYVDDKKKPSVGQWTHILQQKQVSKYRPLKNDKITTVRTIDNEIKNVFIRFVEDRL